MEEAKINSRKSKKPRIFILEDDACFRAILKKVCSQIGDTTVVGNVDSAIPILTSQAYDLLLLDWHLSLQLGSGTFLFSEIDNFQPKVERLALFSALDLPNVVKAMKSGVRDILWVGHPKSILKKKIRNSLNDLKSKKYDHSFPGYIANLLTEKAYHQKNTLFQARREFSRVFLQQLLDHGKFRKGQIATILDISSKTLRRYLYT